MSLILITNDDGIHSEGLFALKEAMDKLGRTVVVAPDREKSAVSHALTMHRPLKVEKLKEDVYTVNGTPTDCVVIALGKILKERPDVLVSGINRGANLGDDVGYSGTVSAAIEGTLFGVPSVAFSQFYDDSKEIDYTPATYFAERIVRYVLDKGLPPDTLLNVNVPALSLSEIKGIRFTRQGKRTYENAIHETKDPWGRVHYWIGGGTP
ncbi:MAG: 5'/3'-nucleotidase SurE, partial [Nitrospirae bacterium]